MYEDVVLTQWLGAGLFGGSGTYKVELKLLEGQNSASDAVLATISTEYETTENVPQDVSTAPATCYATLPAIRFPVLATDHLPRTRTCAAKLHVHYLRQDLWRIQSLRCVGCS